MKKFLLLILILITLTACGQTEAAPTATNTPVPPTATYTPIPPTATNTPEPTLTPTPMPYYLEDGSLYDLDEATGEYLLVGEGLAAITTTADEIVAVDGDGEAVFIYEGGAWVEVVRMPDSVWGFMAPPDWGRPYLEYVRQWVNGYEFPDEVKVMSYTDGTVVPFENILQNKTDLSPKVRNYSMVLADFIQIPDEIYDYSDNEFQLLVLSPTDAGDLSVGGDIVSIRLREVSRKYDHKFEVRIVPENGIVSDSYNWGDTTDYIGVWSSDLVRFFQAGLNGDGAPLKGCQMIFRANILTNEPDSWIGVNGLDSWLANPSGDGVWQVGEPSTIKGSDAGLVFGSYLAVPETCMTPELWTLLNSMRQ